MAIHERDMGDMGNSPDIFSGVHEWNEWYPLESTIVSMIAAITNRQPDDIPPLYESVDADAVERILLDSDGYPREDVSVSFTHCDCRITVDSSGELLIDLLESPDREPLSGD